MNDKSRENYQAHKEHQSQPNESYPNEKIYRERPWKRVKRTTATEFRH